MIGSMLRSALLAALMTSVGPGVAEQIERRLGGKRAMAARAHMAHRSLMAILFSRIKRARRT